MGEVEAKTGRPFVGPAGRVLDSLLADVGLEREDIYITNVVKDRPPDNRDPRVKDETVRGKLWDGLCYVFDQRIAIHCVQDQWLALPRLHAPEPIPA